MGNKDFEVVHLLSGNNKGSIFVTFVYIYKRLRLLPICRHKALKDLKDEILKRHFDFRDLASGYVSSLSQFLSREEFNPGLISHF